MPSKPKEELVRGPDGRLLERHLYPNVKGALLRSSTIILLGDEDKSDTASIQTAFDHGENLFIEGGFYGINARTAATEYANLQLQRQLEQDRAQFALEREKLAWERERQQAELEIERLRAQNNAASAWPNGNNAQYMNPNSYPGFMGNPTFYGQPMNGQQFGAGYGQSSAYPAAPGPPLHSQSDTQVPTFPEAHPAPPPLLSRAQTDSHVRHAPQFMDSDNTGGGTTSHHSLKERLPEAPSHVPRGN